MTLLFLLSLAASVLANFAYDCFRKWLDRER